MQLSRVQYDSICDANARLNLWHGPVRSGKTIASIVRWLKYVEDEAPPGELYMFGRTFSTLKRNVLVPLEEMVGTDYHLHDKVATLWGRRINIIGMNDAKAEKIIRGSTSAGSYFDEPTTYPEGAWNMAQTRMSVPGTKGFGATNPDNPKHWLKTQYLDRADSLDLYDVTWPIDANPFLPDEFVRELHAQFTGLFYRRFILGEWVAAEGAVYPMMREEVHVSTDFPRPDQYIVGVDYGTSVPMVFLLIGIQYQHHRPPTVWVEREHYWDPTAMMRQKTDGEHARDLMKFLAARSHPIVPINCIYVDPSALSFRLECSNCGIGSLHDIDTADNAVVAGISTVSTMLADGRLRIHADCEQTLTEFAGYVWDPKSQERGKDAPKKTGDHAMDALRYALHTHFGERAEAAAWARAVRGVR